MKLGVRGGNSPTGFLGSRGFRIINAIKNLIWANKQVDDYLEDQKGSTTYEAVRPAKIIGDVSTYFEVDDFTDADLPTNCTYIFNFKKGFTLPSASSYLIDMRSGIGVGYLLAVSNDLFSDSGTIVNNINTEGIVKIINPTWSFSKLILLNRFSLDEGWTEDLQTFKITNTDTEEILVEYNAQTLINRDGTFKDYLEDISGNGHHAQQFVQPAIPALEDDSLVGSKYNDDGYSVARALGKNLFNKDVAMLDMRQDVNGDLFASATTSTSEYILLSDAIDDFYLSGANTGSGRYVCYFDENLNFISSVSYTIELLLSKPSNAKYTRVSFATTELETVQLEQGTTPTTYEAWEGIYLDEALTIPYKDGDFISALNTTKCIGWISDGQGGAERASLDFKGRVKFDVDIVDGVVDFGNVLDGEYSQTQISEITQLSKKTIELIPSGTDTYIILNDLRSVKSSTEYVYVRNITSLNRDSNEFIFEYNDGSFVKSTYIGTTNIGEIRTLITTDANTNNLRFRMGAKNAIGEQIEYEFEGLYEASQFTNPLTDPLPNTGEFVQGNTWKLDTAYNKAVIADVNEHVFDKLDPTEVVSKLNNCEDAVYSGDYLFTSLKDDGIVAMYEVAQTGQTLADILKNLELYEYATDGVRAVDSEGYYAIAPKTTTTIIN